MCVLQNIMLYRYAMFYTILLTVLIVLYFHVMHFPTDAALAERVVMSNSGTFQCASIWVYLYRCIEPP